MRLVEIYRLFPLNTPTSGRARVLLLQTNWFTVNTHPFDPKTGEALPQSLSAFLAKVAQTATTEPLRDRLWRIMEHARPSVERLFRALNESPRREHAMLPVHAVRELDASSFIKLSNRPGRNIREKLAGNPYLQAVRRFQSVNLPENRLLKAFVARLLELLELRRDCLGEEEDELLPRIQSWLRSDEAKTIARWDNPPPNNTLLSHRDYRRIWDAWRWLHALDDHIAGDFSRLEAREKTMRKWVELGRLYSLGTHRFAEMPVLFDYEAFEIRPWAGDLVMEKASQRIYRSDATNVISEPVCIDLTELRPRYAITTGGAVSLHYTFLWQQWKSDSKSEDIELFDSDAVYLHPDATSISSPDLFFSKGNSPELLDRAARAFSSKLRKSFKNDTLIWLVPDFLNDFELEIARRNLNARFPKAEPLPRSVAAVFERVDYSKIKNDGFTIVVVDTIGGKTCVTKLIARFDPELQTRIPETKGFYWERCPPVVNPQRNTEDAQGKEWHDHDIITVDVKGRWRDAVRPEKPQFIDQNTLNRIHLTNSPVIGGIRLHTLQRHAGDIPLWRDQIPELAIKVIKDGRYQNFYLVSRGTTVKPILGLPVPIPVHENFTLPAGKPFYQFPLFQGENADELGYSARLDSPAFPLKTNTVCELKITFAYGADDPYELIFVPVEAKAETFASVKAHWQKKSSSTEVDLPCPPFPPRINWADLKAWPVGAKSPRNLISQIVQNLDIIGGLNLAKELEKARRQKFPKRSEGWIKTAWKDGFCFLETNEGNIFCHIESFCEEATTEQLGDRGRLLYFDPVRDNHGRWRAEHVSFTVPEPIDLSAERQRSFIRPAIDEATNALLSVRNTILTAWNHGHHLGEKDAPIQLRQVAKKAKTQSLELITLANAISNADPIKEMISRLADSAFYFLSSLSADAPEEVYRIISEMSPNEVRRHWRRIALVIGDAGSERQKTVFQWCLEQTAIGNGVWMQILGIAVWRASNLVHEIPIELLEKICRRMANVLEQDVGNTILEDHECGGKFILPAVVSRLELCLGLLRTRESNDERTRIILAPGNQLAIRLAKSIEKIEEQICASDLPFLSRIALDLNKPEALRRTPDLLYALQLFLTGDSGARAIQVTGVDDNE